MSDLDALAAQCGIEPAYLDARGARRTVGASTLQALLCAMGIEVDGSAGAARERLQQAAWSVGLPPVCVLYPDGAGAVTLTLPSNTRSVRWHVDLEAGGSVDGSVDFSLLERADAGPEGEGDVERRLLAMPPDLPWGYHRLSVAGVADAATLIVTPGRCWLPEALAHDTPVTEEDFDGETPPRAAAGGAGMWGLSAQVYLLRSAHNWGIGDFGDLRVLTRLAARLGADVVGVNPLHAGFADAPQLASPYSPASRLLLNVLSIDIARLPETAVCPAARALMGSPAFQQSLQACRASPLVDYPGVAALKMPVLELLHATLESRRASARWRRFDRFRQNLGESSMRGCVFLALREHFAAATPARADWHGWPAEYRDPDSPAVARFAAQHADRVAFQIYLQFVADGQLAAVARAARGMAVGLYRDLAVGAAREGAETWANQAAVVDAAAVGAPPDIYNPQGQDWGVPPFNPRALRAESYRSFIELIRANMHHAGGLRIDHVMALQQLYWVPQGRPPSEGGYVRYPLEDLIGILALESHRHRCLVVGEDLGTVPAGFRERMTEANILSYRVLYFERDADGFLPPSRYPPLALAVAGSHDLPTLRAWLTASDLELKKSLNLYPDERDEERARRERVDDRHRLLEALRRCGLLGAGDDQVDQETFFLASHRFLARTRAALAVVQLDDVTAEASPVNVPTTSDEYPNWRRRMSVTMEQLKSLTRLHAAAAIMGARRGRLRPGK